MSLSNNEYVIIWSRRSHIPNVIAIFTRSEAVALAPKSRVLAGSGAVIGGTPAAGSVGAIPLSDCDDQFGFTRQRRWDDLSFTVASNFVLALRWRAIGHDRREDQAWRLLCALKLPRRNRQERTHSHIKTRRPQRRGEAPRVSRPTPPQVKCELGRKRAGTGAFPAPCSDRHLQGATGVLLSGFRFFASDSRCQIRLLGAFCRQARQPAPREVRRISQRP